MAAKGRHGSVVEHGADGQGVFRRGKVREPLRTCVRLCDDVELAVPPDGGVEFARIDAPTLEGRRGASQAHVHDQRLHRDRTRACGSVAQIVHGPVNHVGQGSRKHLLVVMEHLGEADVSDRRRHAGEARREKAVSRDGPGHVGPVAVRVGPQILVVPGRVPPEQVDAADAVPVFRDVRVVDVEAAVHHPDGNRGAARAREDARQATVDAQRVRTHGRHGSVRG